MGFSTIIDIIGSMIVGGFLMLLLFRLNDSATANLYNSTEELILQQNLTTTAMILERDFRRIGYCSDYTGTSSTAISYASDTSITFQTDEKENGHMGDMKYYVGSPSELTSTPNPKDRYLYRVAEGEVPIGVNLGITAFKIVYYDVLGNQLATPMSGSDCNRINSMEINICVENVIGYGGKTKFEEDNKYSQAFWRQIRLANKNLQQR